MDNEEVVKELFAVRKELADVKAETASRKPIEEIVKYLLYFWLSLSVLLGLLGWKQISDVGATISNEVSKQLPRDSEQYRKYETLIADTKKLTSDFEKLTKQYKERVDDLKYAEVVASDFDIEGQMQIVLQESNNPLNVSDAKWRTKAITVLTKLKSAITTKYFPADQVFNAAQVCRQLKQYQLAEELTAAAFSKDPTPPIKALKLASLASNKTGAERAAAFGELMKMVEGLDPQHSPHIVLAEAWNAAESARLYDPLLAAIEKYVSKQQSIEPPPSYTYIIKAQALLRRSKPGDMALAKAALNKGREAFLLESPMSQWNENFVDHYRWLLNEASSNRVASLEEGSDAPGRGEQLELLKRLLERAANQAKP